MICKNPKYQTCKPAFELLVMGTQNIQNIQAIAGALCYLPEVEGRYLLQKTASTQDRELEEWSWI